MATTAPLGNQLYAIFYKRLQASTGSGDNGALVLLIRQGLRGRAVEKRTITTDGNRPHILYVQGYLLLCWDNARNTLLQIEKVTVSKP